MDRFERAGVTDKSKVHIDDSGNFANFVNLLNTGKYKFAVIDSMNMLRNVSNDELLQLMKEFPEVSFIIIAHANKDGKIYKGAGEIQFDVDTIIVVKQGVAETTKHRDGESGRKINIFEHTKNNNPVKIKYRIPNIFID